MHVAWLSIPLADIYARPETFAGNYRLTRYLPVAASPNFSPVALIEKACAEILGSSAGAGLWLCFPRFSSGHSFSQVYDTPAAERTGGR